MTPEDFICSIRLCTKRGCLETRGPWLYCKEHERKAVAKGMLNIPMEHRPREWFQSQWLRLFFPAEPIQDLIRHRAETYENPHGREENTENAIGRKLKLSGTRLKEVMQATELRWDVVDRICTNLGTSPASVYGMAWQELAV